MGSAELSSPLACTLPVVFDFYKKSEKLQISRKMVFYFETTVVDPPRTLFMGLDKHENEELIKWGWPEDVWFHVDKLSSAHVYLRLKEGETLDDVPMSVIEDAAQLDKANSISGNKMNDIDVVYTMWSNLKKTDGMVAGQVGFHKDKEVRKIRVSKRENHIVNRLNKTKREVKTPDLRTERESRDKLERDERKKINKEIEAQGKEDEKKRQAEAELRSYDRVMTEDQMKSNKDGGSDSDDFM